MPAMPAMLILIKSEMDPQSEAHATFGVGKYTFAKNSPEEAATFPNKIAIAARKKCACSATIYIKIVCSWLAKGFGTLDTVLYQKGQAEKLQRKTCKRQDKIPPEVIAKETSFNIAINLNS